MHNQPREPQPCEDCQANQFKNLATVVFRGVLPGLRRTTVAQWSKVLFSDESKFCISFGNLESGGRMEKLISQVAWSPVLSFHSMWWFEVQCDLLVLVHYVFWKPKSLHPFTKTFWSTSCFLLLTSFLKMLISFSFHFPAGFGTCPHCQKHQKLVKWPWCWCAWLASKLTRHDPHRESIVKRKMRNKRPKNADELKATVKETWASIPTQQCHKLITSMPRRIEAVIKAEGAPTKYWVHIL